MQESVLESKLFHLSQEFHLRTLRLVCYLNSKISDRLQVQQLLPNAKFSRSETTPCYFMQNTEVGGWGVIEDRSRILVRPREFSFRIGFGIQMLA